MRRASNFSKEWKSHSADKIRSIDFYPALRIEAVATRLTHFGTKVDPLPGEIIYLSSSARFAFLSRSEIGIL